VHRAEARRSHATHLVPALLSRGSVGADERVYDGGVGDDDGSEGFGPGPDRTVRLCVAAEGEIDDADDYDDDSGETEAEEAKEADFPITALLVTGWGEGWKRGALGKWTADFTQDENGEDEEHHIGCET
jgi:hypothetical protein